jgi:hypothetical protein
MLGNLSFPSASASSTYDDEKCAWQQMPTLPTRSHRIWLKGRYAGMEELLTIDVIMYFVLCITSLVAFF